jgi:hypothetical protein
MNEARRASAWAIAAWSGAALVWWLVGCESATPPCAACPTEATVELAALACEELNGANEVALCQLGAVAARSQCVAACK